MVFVEVAAAICPCEQHFSFAVPFHKAMRFFMFCWSPFVLVSLSTCQGHILDDMLGAAPTVAPVATVAPVTPTPAVIISPNKPQCAVDPFPWLYFQRLFYPLDVPFQTVQIQNDIVSNCLLLMFCDHTCIILTPGSHSSSLRCVPYGTIYHLQHCRLRPAWANFINLCSWHRTICPSHCRNVGIFFRCSFQLWKCRWLVPADHFERYFKDGRCHCLHHWNGNYLLW